jgi:hypothetical protein
MKTWLGVRAFQAAAVSSTSSTRESRLDRSPAHHRLSKTAMKKISAKRASQL